MADKIISASLKVNTGTAAADIGAVNKQLGKTTEELGNANEGSKETTSSFATLKDGLGKIPGPLKSVTGGVDTLSSSLKALAANPIVLVVTLLVAALYGLYKAFASTEAGAEKIEQIFSGLGAIITVIRDRVLALAGAVVDFFKGNFRQAIEEAKTAVTGVGDAMVKAYNAAADSTRRLQEAQDELNRVINVNRAKLERDLAATKELITDETASYQDRKKAIDEVRDAEQKQTQSELDNAQKTLTALQDKLNLDKESSDLRDQVAAQQAKVYQIQEQQSQTIRQLNKEDHQIDMQQKAESDAASQKAHELKKQQLAEELALQKELADKEKQATEDFLKRVNDGIKFRQQQADDKKQQDEKDQKDQEEYQKKIDDQEQKALNTTLANSKKEDEANKKSAELAKEVSRQKVQAYQNIGAAAGDLADLIGRQTVAGKALAAAQALINTWVGVTQVLANKTLLPEPLGTINKIASIAGIVAAGLSAVRNINKVNPTGGGGVGGSADAGIVAVGSPSAPVAPQQTGTTIDQNSIAGIGNAVSGRNYVLSQDVSHDQDRSERLNRQARLGG
jgi:chemotaxis protein histidine kinase CheA